MTLFLLAYALHFKDPGQGHMASKSMAEFLFRSENLWHGPIVVALSLQS